MPYRNAHVECSPDHGATVGFAAVHIFASVKYVSGRTLSSIAIPWSFTPSAGGGGGRRDPGLRVSGPGALSRASILSSILACGSFGAQYVSRRTCGVGGVAFRFMTRCASPVAEPLRIPGQFPHP